MSGFIGPSQETILSTGKPAGGEEVGSIAPALDDGFVSGASASGDKSEASRGYIDYWVIKLK